MERKQGENYTKENDGQVDDQQEKEDQKMEPFTNSAQQVADNSTNLLELNPEQSSKPSNFETDFPQKKEEVVLKVSLDMVYPNNEYIHSKQVLERMDSSEVERSPIRKARNTSMNKSVKGNYHVAVQRDKLDSYRFYKNRYESKESNAEEVRSHSNSISDNYQAERLNSEKSTNHLPLVEMKSDSFEDDVFAPNSKFSRLESVNSATSTTTILNNPHNNFNHRMHALLWCPCMLFFYLCCSPAIYFMTNSDHSFRENDEKRAKLYAWKATVLYIIGTIFALLFYCGLFALVIHLI